PTRRTAPPAPAGTARGAARSAAAAATTPPAGADRAAGRPRPREHRHTEPPPSLHSAAAGACHPRLPAAAIERVSRAIAAAPCPRPSPAPPRSAITGRLGPLRLRHHRVRQPLLGAYDLRQRDRGAH